MKEFYNSIGFILCFMLCCVGISAILGEKFLNKFLLLVLTSQILINADDFINYINGINKKVTNDEKGIEKYNDFNVRT